MVIVNIAHRVIEFLFKSISTKSLYKINNYSSTRRTFLLNLKPFVETFLMEQVIAVGFEHFVFMFRFIFVSTD